MPSIIPSGLLATRRVTSPTASTTRPVDSQTPRLLERFVSRIRCAFIAPPSVAGVCLRTRYSAWASAVSMRVLKLNDMSTWIYRLSTSPAIYTPPPRGRCLARVRHAYLHERLDCTPERNLCAFRGDTAMDAVLVLKD